MIRTTEAMTLDAGDRFDGRVVDHNNDDNDSVDDNYPVTTTTRPERPRIDS